MSTLPRDSADRDTLPDASLAPPVAALLGPPADRIPLFPASWYRFCTSRELTRPIGKQIAGRWLVGFRGEDGRATIMEGRCVHQGADLSRGAVTDGCLRCPFHGWEFDAAGRCQRTPTGPPPGFARQRTYTTVERHGSVFFFSGGGSGGPTFELPTADDFAPQGVRVGPVLQIRYHAPWHVVMANAFDIPHFLAVHDRKLVGESVIDQPSPWSRRIRYTVEIVGRRLTDRFLRRFVGREVRVEHTVWAGNVLMTRARFARAENVVLFVNSPIDAEHCLMEAIPFRPRGSPWIDAWWAPLSLRLRAALTRNFLEHENRELGSVSYSPGTFVEADRPVVDFLHWIAALHGPAGARGEPNLSKG